MGPWSSPQGTDHFNQSCVTRTRACRMVPQQSQGLKVHCGMRKDQGRLLSGDGIRAEPRRMKKEIFWAQIPRNLLSLLLHLGKSAHGHVCGEGDLASRCHGKYLSSHWILHPIVPITTTVRLLPEVSLLPPLFPGPWDKTRREESWDSYQAVPKGSDCISFSTEAGAVRMRGSVGGGG